MRKKLGVVVVVLTLALGAIAFAEEDAELTVIHGIPEFGEVIVTISEGALPDKIEIELEEYGDTAVQSLTPSLFPYVIETTVTRDLEFIFLGPGENHSAIVHLVSEDATTNAIEVSSFKNKISPIDCRKTRLTIRHTAGAPHLDVNLRRGLKSKRFVLEVADLSNDPPPRSPEEFGAADLRMGLYGLVFSETEGEDGRERAFGPFLLRSGQSTIFYAVGSTIADTDESDGSDDSFDLFVQTIDLHESPEASMAAHKNRPKRNSK